VTPAIVVQGLSKRYRLGSVVRPVTGLYEVLEQKLPFLRRKALRDQDQGPDAAAQQAEQESHLVLSPRQLEGCPPGHFWALRDVSFEIAPGDRVGIVGKNGSGKSTLLKILSRITPPTTGSFSIDGRLVSLLEVGTGFHPDLSGRENIFLNAQINGMTASGVRRIFDEIVEFSELGKQIDTPIKRYSSGMYMRLAFSVAAHLDSEILIVDEVLAVGDAGFQKKCLDKMLQVSGQGGRTLLFVSHDMNAISTLCNKALELSHGQVVEAPAPVPPATPPAMQEVGAAQAAAPEVIQPAPSGLRSVNDAIADYLLESSAGSAREWGRQAAPSMDNGCVVLRRIAVTDRDGKVTSEFGVRDEIRICVEFDVTRADWKLNTHIYLKTLTGQRLLMSMDNLHPVTSQVRAPGSYRETCIIHPELLNEGVYRIEVVICTNPTTRHNIAVADALTFTLTDDKSPEGLRGDWVRDWPDYPVRPRLAWDIAELASQGTEP
jgi:lipopolysaccharide transport system ATP-binding protein